MRLPVTGSTRRQYLVLAVPGGALVVPKSAAGSGNVATAMLKAMINSLCAMSFLPGVNADKPHRRRFSGDFDDTRADSCPRLFALVGPDSFALGDGVLLSRPSDLLDLCG